jgi:hypothetical protein
MSYTKITVTHAAAVPLPFYSPRAEELPPRPGVDGHRFQSIGKRGGRVQIPVHVLVADGTAWTSFDSAIKAVVGTVIELASTTEGWTITCLLHGVAPLDAAARTVHSTDGSTRIWRGTVDITICQ